MADLVVALRDATAKDAAVTGGKGAALARMVEAGLPVPDGFVVTTHAFEEATAHVRAEIERIIDAAGADDLAALERACAEAAKLITARRPPRDLVVAVHAAYEQLDLESVAVRSSATAEDLPTASFAGQYDTFLNVRTRAQVVQRVLEVWASLYSPHAVAYRRQQKIAHESVRMAVVVQQLLPSSAAGVLFTRDPVSGAEDRYVINVALGLGEGVVAGEAPADRFAVDIESGDVVSRDIAAKEHMVGLAPKGGIRRAKVKAGDQKRPALSDGQLGALGALAGSVRELFGGHQDIEFAVQDGFVYLLQARAVTAIDEEPEFQVTWDDPKDAEQGWLLMQTGQRAKPAYRLEEGVLKAYMDGSRVCFKKTGSPMARFHVSRFINGFRYGRSPDIEEKVAVERLLRHRKRGERYIAARTSIWEADLREPTERAVAELAAFRPRRATLPQLFAHMERAIAAFAHVLGDLHWRLAGSGDPRRKPWQEHYHEITGEPEVDAGVFLQALENKTTGMIRRLRDLARLVQNDRTLRAIFSKRDYGRLSDASVHDRPAVRRFRHRFRSFIKRHGRRTGRGFGAASDFATPTWGMKPETPLALIGSYADQDIDAMERMEDDARREREAATQRVRQTLAGDPERLARLEDELWRVQDQLRWMENHNHMMEQAIGGALREAIDFVGCHLVRAKRLNDADDVLHLSLDELRAVAAGKGPDDLRALVRERAAEYQTRSRMKPPATLGSGNPPEMPRFYDPPANVGRDGMLIRGVPASRGKVTGRARVPPMTAQPPDVEKGDILVAQNAGPNWTPVFPLLGGLVLDQGAVFQHAALVAREYKIPAVIMAKDATKAISDGQTIAVDGDEGIIDLNP